MGLPWHTGDCFATETFCVFHIMCSLIAESNLLSNVVVSATAKTLTR